MGSTEELIEGLSGEMTAVRRLWKPTARSLAWIGFGSFVVLLFVLVRGLRGDLAHQMVKPTYWVQLGSAWIAGVLATLACFQISLPDRSRWWLLLPVPALALWFVGFGYGCLANWIAIPAGARLAHDDLSCMITLVGSSIPLGLVMWALLRRTRPLRVGQAAWLGGIAVAGFADTAHLLINQVNPSAQVLLMNLTPSLLIAAVVARLASRVRPADFLHKGDFLHQGLIDKTFRTP